MNNQNEKPRYMLIGDNAKGVLLRRCGKTVSAVQDSISQVLSIKAPSPSFITEQHIAIVGLEPMDIGEEYTGTRYYSIEQNPQGSLGFQRIKKGEQPNHGEIRYFRHSQTKEIIGIYY